MAQYAKRNVRSFYTDGILLWQVYLLNVTRRLTNGDLRRRNN